MIKDRAAMRESNSPESRRDVNREDRSTLGQDERAPRWVKAFGIIALLLIIVVVVVHLAGGGFHAHSMR